MEDLIHDHYLVPVTTDDKQLVDQLRAAWQLTRTKEKAVTRYTILPTTGCNARCFYCYESGCDEIPMTEQTADAVASFIINHCQGKAVHLSWFGGEPLLGRKRILQICNRLQDAGIPFSSRMTSNGILFSEPVVEEAKKLWNLKKVQITLDGTEQIYNATKNYIHASGSPFRTVLENIARLAEAKIRVSIRLNMDQHNADDLEQLVGQLSDCFCGNPYVSVYVALLYRDMGSAPIARSDDEHRRLERRATELTQRIIDTGLHPARATIPFLKVNQCQADHHQAMLINPKGEIGKCEHHLFDQLIGNIHEDVINAETEAFWKETHHPDLCDDCPLYPGCINLRHCSFVKECTRDDIAEAVEHLKKTMASVAGHPGKISCETEDDTETV